MPRRALAIAVTLVLGPLTAARAAGAATTRDLSVALVGDSGKTVHAQAVEARLLAGLSSERGVTLVERQQVDKILSEMKLGLAGLEGERT